MKKIIMSFMSIASIAAILTISSCAKDEDKCKNVTCQNSGTCVDGTCNCTAGYEGTNCETVARTKFLKTAANVSEDCTSVTYVTDIVTGTNIDELKVKNLGNYSCPSGDYYVVAKVTGANLTIESQSFCNVGGTNVYTVTGTGTINTTTHAVTITYHVTATGVNDNCVATIL